MVAAHTLPHTPAIRQIPKHGVLVLHGFGIKVRMDNSHFCAEWGVGLERYQVRLSRVDGHKLRRVILLGSDGYISLEALRFISDVGATFSMIDKRGKALMVCGPVAPSDSKLRRAQSLALGNGTALRISKEIIAKKLDGQATLVRDMLHNSAISNDINILRTKLPNAENIESVRVTEAMAARCYWQAWVDVPIRWARKDERRVPSHWTRFSSRISRLSHSPRLACDPANACMNLLHCLCENEARIALVACGLDADIACLHADTPGRSSLANDLQEIVRPKVDAFVLNFIQNEVLRKSDFWEDRNGTCRLSSALAIKLCQTSDTWRRLISSHAEWLALKLYESVPTRSPLRASPATRLTQSHRRVAKGSSVPAITIPKTDHVCRGCGKKIPGGENRCLKCSAPVTRQNFDAGRKMAQSKESLTRRSITQAKHRRAIHNWEPSKLPAWLTREVYLSRIVPKLATVPKSRIRSALSISEPYSAYIQTGQRIPHPRHWKTLAQLSGVGFEPHRHIETTQLIDFTLRRNR